MFPLCDAIGKRIVWEGASGRLWLLAFRADGGADVMPTAIVLPDFVPSTYRKDYSPQQCVGDRLVITCDEDVFVCSLTTGHILLSLSHFDHGGDTVCLSPDATKLLVFRNSPIDCTAIYRIPDDAAAGGRKSYVISATDPPGDDFRTTIFHYHGGQPLLDAPSSALAVAVPNQPDLCHLVIGCFGFVAVWTVFLGSQPEEIAVKGDPRRSWDFLYDPVTVDATFMYPYVFPGDMYGAELKAFNLETGVLTSCSHSATMSVTKSGYDTFRGLLPGVESFLVRTCDGWIRWWLDGRTESLCPLDYVLLGETASGVWALHKGDPATLLIMSPIDQ